MERKIEKPSTETMVVPSRCTADGYVWPLLRSLIAATQRMNPLNRNSIDLFISTISLIVILLLLLLLNAFNLAILKHQCLGIPEDHGKWYTVVIEAPLNRQLHIPDLGANPCH